MISALRTAAVVAVVAGSALVPQPAMAAAGDPIVFVHGYLGNAAAWNDMKGWFTEAGYGQDRLHAFEYPSDISNVDIANRLSTYVRDVRARTGADKVDVVTHSMGGLSSRHWVKFLGGADVVDDWVSLGGPNHGTDSALLCNAVPCQDMRPGSAFLNELNAGDETPGAVRYGAFWSSCDEAIRPPESAKLDGAENVEVGCVTHVNLIRDRGVYDRVREFVS
ncbi:esterase/lipase family protein [Saccharopolyspora taberi]|uniref:Triacylglycerol lipase n=1 Tax=Saccharopolyspora taberi TaxID=60895 RepID=A0ABN3VBF0_9PSEU